MCLCDHESPVGNPLHNSKFKFRACIYRPRRSSFEFMIGFKLSYLYTLPVYHRGTIMINVKQAFRAKDATISLIVALYLTLYPSME